MSSDTERTLNGLLPQPHHNFPKLSCSFFCWKLWTRIVHSKSWSMFGIFQNCRIELIVWPMWNLCRFERIDFTRGLLTRHRGKMSCWAVSVFNQDWLICSMLLLPPLLVCLARIWDPWMCLLLRPICVELRSPCGNKDRKCIRTKGICARYYLITLHIIIIVRVILCLWFVHFEHCSWFAQHGDRFISSGETDKCATNSSRNKPNGGRIA